MPFHSPDFLLLCLLTFAVYWLAPPRFQRLVLLAGSVGFYAYAGLFDLLLLLAVVAANHVASRFVAERSRVALAGILTANLGVLGYFKYRDMWVEWAATVLGLPAPEAALSALDAGGLVIPLGISFYVFQLIAYQVDLHRGDVAREPSGLRLLLYVLFFPHHQAGPIMRPSKFLPQFYGEKRFDLDRAGVGALWILWGLAKKVAADNLASGVDAGFRDAATLGGVGSAAEAWSLALRYALQIYGDFSGYSDIAVGLGLLFGYELDRNFDQPYLATDPSMFWRRWHITLSAWLRDYVYIPLGGNRLGPARTPVNLMLTMLLGGLWHGASVLFVLWGGLHGLLLLVHRVAPSLFRIRAVGLGLTLGATVVAWVPFRAETWSATRTVWRAMFGASGLGSPRELLGAGLVLVGLLASQWAEDRVLRSQEARAAWLERWRRVPAAARGVALAVGLLAVVTFVVDETSYIYSRF